MTDHDRATIACVRQNLRLARIALDALADAETDGLREVLSGVLYDATQRAHVAATRLARDDLEMRLRSLGVEVDADEVTL
jgi:hypothetical protein